MTNLEQYAASVPLGTWFEHFFCRGCAECPAAQYCHAQPEGTCCRENFVSWAGGCADAPALSALRSELEQVERQRDAAVADIEGLLDRVEQIRQGYGIEDETADNKLATLCEEYCTGTGTNCYKPGRRYECKSFCWRGLKEGQEK